MRGIGRINRVALLSRDKTDESTARSGLTELRYDTQRPSQPRRTSCEHTCHQTNESGLRVRGIRPGTDVRRRANVRHSCERGLMEMTSHGTRRYKFPARHLPDAQR